MKFNKVFNKIAVIILILLVFAGIILLTNNITKKFLSTKNINANVGNYTAVQYGDERVDNTNFVTFDIYFLKNGNKYRGEYLPYTKAGDFDYNISSKDLFLNFILK